MKSASGFKIKELAVLLATLSLCGLLFGASQSRIETGSDMITCKNNIKVISEALLADAAENNDRFLWTIKRNPAYLRGSPNVWENFIILSNFLSSPRVFACPADLRQPAQNFSSGIGGLAYAEHQNNSVSYFISTDALLSIPNNALIGERNLDGGVLQHCSVIAPYPIAYAFDRTFGAQNRLKWKPMLHGPDWGLISTVDGNVLLLDTPAVNRAFVNFEGDGNFNNHVLLPL